MRNVAIFAAFGAVAVFGASSAAAQDFLGQLLKSAAGQIATQIVTQAVTAQPALGSTDSTAAAAQPTSTAEPSAAPAPVASVDAAAPLQPGEKRSSNPNYRTEAERLAAERDTSKSYLCHGYSDPSPRCQW